MADGDIGFVFNDLSILMILMMVLLMMMLLQTARLLLG